MAQAKITHPRQRAILGIIAVILVVIFANWIVKSTAIGNTTLDLTENNRHTLTDGTKSILNELNTPVIIRYYASRDSKVMPRSVKNYMRTVDGVLERYRKLSGGKIRIEHYDPQPDTDAEDSANLDGIRGERLNNENLYFGLSISCLDQQTSIPFLDPSSETMLEYQLSSAIANVSKFEKTTVGLMTTLPLYGSPAQQPGQRPQQPWIIYQYLRQLYDIQPVSTTPDELDPAQMPVLLLIHPAGLTQQTEFLIDQYVLKGGIVVACLDPFALTAPSGDPRMGGMGGTPRFSSLPSLLKAWGIGFDATSVVADGKYPRTIGNNQQLYSHLTLNADAITSQEEIITKDFQNLYLPLAGGFTIKGGGGISIETLIRTSKEVVFVEGQQANQPDPGLFARKATSGKNYALAMRLKGTFSTAFPEGNPNQSQNSEKTDDKDGTTNDTTKEQEQQGPPALKKGIKEGIVYLISDADFLYDTACFRQTIGGWESANNNTALLQNILDQCTGSRHLIGSRSRAATTRPFTVIKEMETDFKQEIRDEVTETDARKKAIYSELQQLQAQKSQGKALVLTPEQEQKIHELRAENIKLNKEMREKEKGLQTKKDKLYSKLTWMTVAITPTFIALIGLGVWIYRKRITRAQ